MHWGTDYAAGHQSDGSSWVGPDFSADFHVFGLEGRPDAIIWTVDGVEHKRHAGDGIPQVPMYVILNLAIGGGWPGAPDATTPFPARYQIDYVRAYAALLVRRPRDPLNRGYAPPRLPATRRRPRRTPAGPGAGRRVTGAYSSRS